jgi:hypothetical protein
MSIKLAKSNLSLGFDRRVFLKTPHLRQIERVKRELLEMKMEEISISMRGKGHNLQTV